MPDFSERLKKLRKSKNLTQKQLGENIGTSERGIQNYELGTRKPTYDILISLAKYFNVPLDYLVGNGIYAYWDKVLEVKPIIIEKLYELQAPKEIIDKLETDDNFFLKCIPAIVDKIVFDDTSKEITIHFFA